MRIAELFIGTNAMPESSFTAEQTPGSGQTSAVRRGIFKFGLKAEDSD